MPLLSFVWGGNSDHLHFIQGCNSAHLHFIQGCNSLLYTLPREVIVYTYT